MLYDIFICGEIYTDRRQTIFNDWDNNPDYKLPADTKDVKTLVRVIARMSDYYVNIMKLLKSIIKIEKKIIKLFKMTIFENDLNFSLKLIMKIQTLLIMTIIWSTVHKITDYHYIYYVLLFI